MMPNYLLDGETIVYKLSRSVKVFLLRVVVIFFLWTFAYWALLWIFGEKETVKYLLLLGLGLHLFYEWFRFARETYLLTTEGVIHLRRNLLGRITLLEKVPHGSIARMEILVSPWTRWLGVGDVAFLSDKDRVLLRFLEVDHPEDLKARFLDSWKKVARAS